MSRLLGIFGWGKLWVRITIGTSVVLFVTLGVVVVAVYELTLASERRDLDEVLIREGSVITNVIIGETQNLLETQSGSRVTIDNLREIASRALALHPGSPLHMVNVRWDGQTVSSARGPDRLISLRDASMLPIPTSGTLESKKGIRSRSIEINLPDFSVSVETLGDDQEIADDARDVARRTLLAALIGGMVGLLALSITARRSTRVISAVTETVRNTRLENLSYRVPDFGGTDEVALLAQDINKMLQDLDEARSIRNELIASVSHEIRTPLAAARGHAELLRSGRAKDPAVTIERIDRELNRMTRLVDDFLALSRAADPRWISTRVVNVRTIMADLIERVSAIGISNIKFEDAPDLLVDVDADRLLQALSNLVANAVIHTPQSTQITVMVKSSGSLVDFVVTDNGPGIPPDVLENFGEAFVRGSETGTGLGLAVCRAVAMAHQGSLFVRSDESGTEVVIRIPIDRQA